MIKIYRELKGLTQEKVARQVNVTLRNYQNIEHYKVRPNVITALTIARLLDFDPYVFLENYQQKKLS